MASPKHFHRLSHFGNNCRRVCRHENRAKGERSYWSSRDGVYFKNSSRSGRRCRRRFHLDIRRVAVLFQCPICLRANCHSSIIKLKLGYLNCDHGFVWPVHPPSRMYGESSLSWLVCFDMICFFSSSPTKSTMQEIRSDRYYTF